MNYVIGGVHLLHYCIYHDILRHSMQEVLADRNVLDLQLPVCTLCHFHHLHIRIRYKMIGYDQEDSWCVEDAFVPQHDPDYNKIDIQTCRNGPQKNV